MIEKRNNHTLIVGIVVGGIVLLIVLYYIYDLLHYFERVQYHIYNCVVSFFIINKKWQY